MGWAILSRSQTILASSCSSLLAIVFHIVPVWFILFGPVFESHDVLEIDLVTSQMFRDRVYRMPEHQTAQAPLEVLPVEMTVSIPVRPETKTKAATPRKEEELARARAVQKAIRNLWDSMAPTEFGAALISLNILTDGSIGDYVVNRVQGNKDFQQFLATFLASLKGTTVKQGGGGDAIWIECEFVIRPTRIKAQ